MPLDDVEHADDIRCDQGRHVVAGMEEHDGRERNLRLRIDLTDDRDDPLGKGQRALIDNRPVRCI